MARKRTTSKGFDRSILKMDETHLQARLTRTGAGVHRTSKHDVPRSAGKRRAIMESHHG